MTRATAGRAAAFVAALACAVPAAAQQVGVALSSDTLTVGDVAYLAVRVRAPAGARVSVPDSLPLQGDLENAGPRRVRVDTLPDGATEVTSLYPFTAWRPGPHPLPAIPVTVSGPQGSATRAAAAPAVHVASVLPPDTAGIEPKPPKDVVGANRAWWPLVVLALLLIAAVAALWWWLRRRRRARAGLAVMVSPREAAARDLDRASAALASGDLRSFYVALSEALRHYLDALDERWGAELTTSELLPRLRRDLGSDAPRDLEPALRNADMVKFARARGDRTAAEEDLRRARQWIAAWPPQPTTVVGPDLADTGRAA